MTAPIADSADWRRSVTAGPLLRIFNDDGIIDASDVIVAQRLSALAGECDEKVALALAFVVRAVRGGSVCLDLATLQRQVGSPELPWPEPAEWVAAVAASPLATASATLLWPCAKKPRRKSLGLSPAARS